MKHAVDAFDSDIKETLVDVHQLLGGAKGRGLKKLKQFKQLCYSRGRKPFKLFVETRFRTDILLYRTSYIQL